MNYDWYQCKNLEQVTKIIVTINEIYFSLVLSNQTGVKESSEI